MKLRCKKYPQEFNNKETSEGRQLKCSYDVVWSLKTLTINVASKSVDDRTRKFSTLSKRIQRDRQQSNYAGYFEDYMKNDAKKKKVISLFAGIKKLVKNFKAHRYKEYFQNDIATLRKEHTNPRYLSVCTFFSLRKRRKKENFIDVMGTTNKILKLLPADINIERKINNIDLCHSDNSTNGCTESCKSDEAIKNWNKNRQNNKMNTKFYGHNTDLNYKIYYKDSTVNVQGNNNEHSKMKQICKKQNSRKSSLSATLFYCLQNVRNYFGPRNKITCSSTNRAHPTYMVMNFEETHLEHDYHVAPVTFCGITAKKGNIRFNTEMENSRNYRLSSYLLEREWMVKHHEISIKSAVRFYLPTFN